MAKFKHILSLIWLPLFAFAALGSFYLVWSLFDLPPREEFIEIARVYFERYGIMTIFISAILEGILLAGWYFPGSFVIVLGVFLAGNDVEQVVEVALATTAGFLISYTFNFYVGKHGWYRLLTAFGFREPLERAQGQLTKYGPRAIFFTYWHPNLAALTSTAAGILQMPYKTFIAYSLAATVVWNTFWTIIGYVLGATALTVIKPQFVVAFIALWIAAIFLFQLKKKPVVEQPAETL